MRIDARLAEIIESTSRRAKERTERGALEVEKSVATADRSRELRARVANLGFAGAQPSASEFERILLTDDLVDQPYLDRAIIAARPVARIVLRDAADREIGYATGAMVSPRLLLTNWHVFPAKGDAANAIAEFDYRLDLRGEPAVSQRFHVAAERFHYSNKNLDYALVAVETTSSTGLPLSTYGYHRLLPDPMKVLRGESMSIIQHPGGERRKFAIRENQLKELEDLYLIYESDTAPGSSGSPVFNDSWQIVGLHHSGRAKREGNLYVLKNGHRVSSLEGVDDSDVVWEGNEGIRISQICDDIAKQPAGEFINELLEAMSTPGDDVMARALQGTAPLLPTEIRSTTTAPVVTTPADFNGSFGPVTVMISVGQPGAQRASLETRARVTPRAIAAGTPSFDSVAGEEKFVRIPVDPHYSNRNGYDEDFLGKKVPLPRARKAATLAKLDSGEHEVPYEHFTVVVNKLRRMAVYSAWNVDGTSAARTPEAGRDYSRKGLTGLGDHDFEQWVTDPRIPEQHQLPDVFYNKDRQAFDKGHVARREDVCWGEAYDEVQRANNDTFHTTNCTPQVQGFNRSQSRGLWGRLENFVLAQAKAKGGDRFSAFAGPIFQDDDPVFKGVDERGAVQIKIPQRFWKVVVVEGTTGLEAYGFVLEQDLGDVAFSPDEAFRPNAEWQSHMVSIKTLGQEIDVTFPQNVLDADQFGKSGGDEVVKKARLTARKTRRASGEESTVGPVVEPAE